MNPILEPLREEVTQCRDVMRSARIFIEGTGARIADAIAQALENGATAEQLAPFTELEAAMESERLGLASAIVANTPSAPV